jgi:nucleoid-associated protein YgaU
VKKAAPATPVAQGPMKEYVAQAGDSLSRIASRVMGANTKANREAIVKANASLHKNPELIIEGRKYMIPDSVKTAATPPAEQSPGPIPAEATARPAKAKTKAVPVTDLVDSLPPSKGESPAGGWYIVKDNDNLWRIANEQLGSGNAWLQLKELNKDILKGKETVVVNQRLRLPAKPLASAN